MLLRGEGVPEVIVPAAAPPHTSQPEFAMQAVLLLLVFAAGDKPREITFAKGDVDKLPAGWTTAKTGEGEGSIGK